MPHLTLIAGLFFLIFGGAMGYTAHCKWPWLDIKERLTMLFLTFMGLGMAVVCVLIAMTV